MLALLGLTTETGPGPLDAPESVPVAREEYSMTSLFIPQCSEAKVPGVADVLVAVR
ncbi:hypothetical protein ACFVXA_29435 [Streptomyces sp. NPDC058246]|uniref:hypothetical protein n=1 Tax=unclassified Streptomyces TaxID=2593676 RepID=UPI00365203DD